MRESIKVYDSGFRGNCPIESAELKTFFNQIRAKYPDSYGRIAFHPRNEGKKSAAQVALEKMEGATPGASDIHIPGNPGFVCELKRKDKTKSRLPDVERDYLIAADNAGAFTCVAYGWEQAWRAFIDWKLSRGDMS